MRSDVDGFLTIIDSFLRIFMYYATNGTICAVLPLALIMPKPKLPFLQNTKQKIVV